MTLRAAVALLVLSVGSASAPANVLPTWVVRHGQLTDPAVSTVSVPDGADLEQTIIDNCADGCILELAPGGTYTCGIIFGKEITDSDWKGTHSGVVDPTGPVVFRGVASAPATLQHPIGSPWPCLYQLKVEEEVRYEHLVIDSRRDEQTQGVIGDLCPDVDQDGLCDGPNHGTAAHGIWIRNSAGPGTAHIYGVTVRDAPAKCIQIQGVEDTTVEASRVEGCGCSVAGECPGLDGLARDASNTQSIIAGRGISMTGERVAVIHSVMRRPTRMAAQCINASDCALIGNNARSTAQICFTAIAPSGVNLISGNSATDCGMLTGEAPIGVGGGIGPRNDDQAGGPVTVSYNRIRTTNWRGWDYSGNLPLVFRALHNDVAGACQFGETTTVAASISDTLAGSEAIGNRIEASRCTTGLWVPNATLRIRDLTILGTPSVQGMRVLNSTIDARGVESDTDIVLDAEASGTLDGCTGAGAVVDNGSSVTGDCLGGP